MIRSRLLKIASIACVGVISAAMFVGCATQQSTLTDEQKANREYMSTVSQKVESLSDTLSSFNDAVSRKDAVTMKTQASNAAKVLDELAAVEAPEALSDIKTNYVNGANALEEALNSYVQLFSDIDSATDANPFDWSSYDARVAEIQAKYDEGISALKSGDEAASSKE